MTDVRPPVWAQSLMNGLNVSNETAAYRIPGSATGPIRNTAEHVQINTEPVERFQPVKDLAVGDGRQTSFSSIMQRGNMDPCVCISLPKLPLPLLLLAMQERQKLVQTGLYLCQISQMWKDG